MEVEFGVRAENPAGAGNFSNMTVVIAGCAVITPSIFLRNTVAKFTSASSATKSTQNSLHFTFIHPSFTVPIDIAPSSIDTTRDSESFDLGIIM